MMPHATGIDEALRFGRRLVPLGFAHPVHVPPSAFVWGGYLHGFIARLSWYVPIARAVRRPSVWLPGPVTEPMIDLAAIASDEFTAMHLDADAAEVFEFDTAA